MLCNFTVTVDLLDTVRMACSQLSGIDFAEFALERRLRDSQEHNVCHFRVIWQQDDESNKLVMLKSHSGIRTFFKPLDTLHEEVSMSVCFLSHVDRNDASNIAMLRCLMNALYAATRGTYPVQIMTHVRNVDESGRVLFRY